MISRRQLWRGLLLVFVVLAVAAFVSYLVRGWVAKQGYLPAVAMVDSGAGTGVGTIAIAHDSNAVSADTTAIADIAGVAGRADGTNGLSKLGPRRIVALAPHLAEILYFLQVQDRLVGRVEHANYPQELNKLPVVGNAFAINYERLLALKPDLVFYWEGGTPREIVNRIEALAIPTMGVEVTTFASLVDEMFRLSLLLGSGRENVVQFANELQQYTTQVEADGEQRLRVFVQIWSDPLWTVGRSHLISDLLHRCGGQGLFDDMPQSAFEVRQESVIARHPELILYAGDEPEAVAKRAWDGGFLASVGKIGIDPDLIQRPGPRALDALKQVCGYISEYRLSALPAGGSLFYQAF